METINSVASAASKAVFGSDDSNKEPVSGAQGDTTKGEPYDAGNLDAGSQEKLEKRLSDDDGRPKPDASEVHDSTRTEPVGPGPKPVDAVAREHGGDAGATDKPATVTEDTKTDAKKEEGKEGEEKKATGQEVVHATGFAAEGGDFDASNPGAGKEADRLVEEKHKDPTGENKPAATGVPDDVAKKIAGNDDSKGKDSKHGKDKPSLSQRIKAKLHRNKDGGSSK